MLITAAECNSTLSQMYRLAETITKYSCHVSHLALLRIPRNAGKNQFIEADMSTCIRKFKVLHFLLVTQMKESQRASGLFFGPSGLQQTQNCLPLFGPSFFTVLKTQGSLWPLHSGG